MLILPCRERQTANWKFGPSSTFSGSYSQPFAATKLPAELLHGCLRQKSKCRGGFLLRKLHSVFGVELLEKVKSVEPLSWEILTGCHCTNLTAKFQRSLQLQGHHRRLRFWRLCNERCSWPEHGSGSLLLVVGLAVVVGTFAPFVEE